MKLEINKDKNQRISELIRYTNDLKEKTNNLYNKISDDKKAELFTNTLNELKLICENVPDFVKVTGKAKIVLDTKIPLPISSEHFYKDLPTLCVTLYPDKTFVLSLSENLNKGESKLYNYQGQTIFSSKWIDWECDKVKNKLSLKEYNQSIYFGDYIIPVAISSKDYIIQELQKEMEEILYNKINYLFLSETTFSCFIEENDMQLE